jgi:hypothetical protein
MDEMEKRVAKMLNKQTLRRMQGSQKLEDVEDADESGNNLCYMLD